jgi:hypothetical protein
MRVVKQLGLRDNLEREHYQNLRALAETLLIMFVAY